MPTSTSYGDTGAALVKGKIDLAFFIGSPQTGKKVMAAAVDNLTPVVLELGGKVRKAKQKRETD